MLVRGAEGAGKNEIRVVICHLPLQQTMEGSQAWHFRVAPLETRG